MRSGSKPGCSTMRIWRFVRPFPRSPKRNLTCACVLKGDGHACAACHGRGTEQLLVTFLCLAWPRNCVSFSPLVMAEELRNFSTLAMEKEWCNFPFFAMAKELRNFLVSAMAEDMRNFPCLSWPRSCVFL